MGTIAGEECWWWFDKDIKELQNPIENGNKIKLGDRDRRQQSSDENWPVELFTHQNKPSQVYMDGIWIFDRFETFLEHKFVGNSFLLSKNHIISKIKNSLFDCDELINPFAFDLIPLEQPTLRLATLSSLSVAG